MILGVGQLQCVDDHFDIGAVLARHFPHGDVDQFHRTLVKGNLVLTPGGKVCVGFFDGDFSFFDQAVKDLVDIQLLDIGFFDTDRNIVEIDEKRRSGAPDRPYFASLYLSRRSSPAVIQDPEIR